MTNKIISSAKNFFHCVKKGYEKKKNKTRWGRQFRVQMASISFCGIATLHSHGGGG